MRKIILTTIVALGVAVSGSALAQHRGGGGGQWSGNGSHGGDWNHGNWNGSSHWRGGDWHGSHWHGGHFRGNFSVFLGPSLYWGPAFYPYYYPAYTYYDYATPVYTAPAPAYSAPPATYQYNAHPATYQYYCPSGGGYYPNVPACPEGWLRVVPR